MQCVCASHGGKGGGGSSMLMKPIGVVLLTFVCRSPFNALFTRAILKRYETPGVPQGIQEVEEGEGDEFVQNMIGHHEK